MRDQTPREFAFCAHALAADDILIVPDATRDDRFSSNPLVTGAPNIRFYAGVPIRAEMRNTSSRRLPLGTLCVIDGKPRDVDPGDMKLLVELAHLVETLIAARSSATYAWPDAGQYAGAAGYSNAARCGAAGGLNYMLGIFP